MDKSPISVEGLEKVYRGGFLRRNQFSALKGVSFDVNAGEVFGLLGPNGAGKTTFIKILLGIVRKSGGRASLLGWPAGDRRGRLRVGYLPEQLRVPRHHNAMTALEYYGRLSGMDWSSIKTRRPELLDLVGLTGRERDSVRKYSKGMLQRLGLAQALFHDPDLVVLDEPTDGLDPVGRRHVRELLKKMKSLGKTVFLNSHLLQEVEMVCDRVAILDRGVLRGMGTPDELAQSKGDEVEFEVEGSVETVQSAIKDQPARHVEAVAENCVRLVGRFHDQPAIDRYVDMLRARGISIRQFGRRRGSLEDTFLNILNANKDAS